jgi:hypothetical protein
MSFKKTLCKIQNSVVQFPYIRPDVSATRPDAFQCSTSKRISFQNTDMGRQLQLFERCGYYVWTLSLIRQVVQKKFNSPDVRLHGLDA